MTKSKNVIPAACKRESYNSLNKIPRVYVIHAARGLRMSQALACNNIHILPVLVFSHPRGFLA